MKNHKLNESTNLPVQCILYSLNCDINEPKSKLAEWKQSSILYV